jgi:hypothetical protein
MKTDCEGLHHTRVRQWTWHLGDSAEASDYRQIIRTHVFRDFPVSQRMLELHTASFHILLIHVSCIVVSVADTAL